jgi:hypothetical protein
MIKIVKTALLLSAVTASGTMSSIQAMDLQDQTAATTDMAGKSAQTQKSLDDHLIAGASDGFIGSILRAQKEITQELQLPQIQEKLLKGQKEIADTIIKLSNENGHDMSGAAERAFETYFLNYIQPPLVRQYLDNNLPTRNRENDYYEDLLDTGSRTYVGWGAEDESYVYNKFGQLPLGDWDGILFFIKNGSKMQNDDLTPHSYITGMKEDSDVYGRGKAFLLDIKEYIEKVKEIAKTLTFGKQ